MALTPEQEKFVADLFSIYQKQSQINSLNSQRQSEEATLVTDYKIDEANLKRSGIVQKYSDLINPIRTDQEAIQAQLTK